MLYFGRCFVYVCCFPCRYFNCCFMFTDKEFPPEASSLGDLVGDTASGVMFQGGKVEWIRAPDLQGKEKVGLFNNSVNSRSIMQGQLGNCWLVAAMAALAEHKGGIYQLFLTKQKSARGIYRINIYDGVAEKWECVTIDDYIPCVNGKPIFSKPVGNAMWVLLLEKAFAKFCGSYANLEAGHTIWALQAMTGDKARIFKRKPGGTTWQRLDLKNLANKTDRRDCTFVPRDEHIDNDKFFEVLRKYNKQKSVLSVSGASGNMGLVRQHAYSILDVINAAGFRMVKIRNPHGHGGEWQGNWSDKSPLWSKHADVKRAAGWTGGGDDGIFYMAWEDFIQQWDQLQIVDRSLDLDMLSLKPKDDSKRSVCKACSWGCFSYWCLCRGLRYMCCPKRSADKTVDVDEKCCFCIPIKRKYKAYDQQKLTTRGIVPSDDYSDYEYESSEYDEDEEEEGESDEEGGRESSPYGVNAREYGRFGY